MSTAHQQLPTAMPLPPVTVVPPQVRAKARPRQSIPPPTPVARVATRQCEHCGNTVQLTALLCTHCKRWTKVIEQLRRQVNVGIAILFISCIAMVATCAIVWPRANEIALAGNCPWHISTNRPQATDWDKLWPTVEWHFSMTKFLTSFSGWLILSMLIVMLFSALSIAERKRSLKLKTVIKC
jgi:hypothetical protein